MKRMYEAPVLFVDEYVADTMIASSKGGPKNDNAGNNQNCWACNYTYGAVEDGENACLGAGYPGCSSTVSPESTSTPDVY